MSRRVASAYMAWAKEISQAPTKHELTGSGIPSQPWSAMPAEDLPLWAPHAYGSPRLRARIGALHGARADQVLLASGTSMTNYLVAAAHLQRGDKVVVESPTYEPLTQTLRFAGAEVVDLPRRWENRFQPDPADLERVIAGAKMVVLTNLHNPTGVQLEPDRLDALVTITARAGALLLVDEVYLDFLQDAPHARVGDHVVVTGSLTKVYGLTGLRAGWAVGPEALIDRTWEVKNLISVLDPYPTEELADRIVARREEFRQPILAHASAGRKVFCDWAHGEGLEFVEPPGGIIVALKLPDGMSGFALGEHLVAAHDTRVVPGEFFDLPGFVRVGFGGNQALLAEGLRRLALGIRELQACAGRA